MKLFFITVHRWLGLPLGLLFVITFGTGFVAAIDELLIRQSLAQFNQHFSYRATSLAEDAAAVSSISQAHKDISRIQFPTLEAPYYKASSRQASWIYAIGDLTQPIVVERQDNKFFSTALQLHRNFLLGRDGPWGIDGKYIAAWVGLMSLLLSLLGLWIWWPLRKSFKLKDVVPQGVKRKHFYFSHMSSGVIVLIAIVVFSLTGAAISYRNFTQTLFAIDRRADGMDFQVKNLDNNWHAWLSAAYGEMPEGAQLKEIRYPRQPQGLGQTNTTLEVRNSEGDESQLMRAGTKVASVANNTGAIRDLKSIEQKTISIPARAAGYEDGKVLLFQFSTRNDWLNLARSEVKIDQQSATLLAVRRFENLPINEKIYSLLMPLHTGKGLPLVYVLLQLAFSLLGTLMVGSGLASFIAKKRRKNKRRFDSAALVASEV